MSRRLGKFWKDVKHGMDTEELAYQMAYDLVEAEEQKAAMTGRQPSHSTEPKWIDLSDPNVFEQLKQRMGMAA